MFKHSLRVIATLAAPLALTTTVSGAEPAPVRIAKYRDNKAAAVCYTFDDGLRSQYTLAVPILNRLKVPGTFFIVSGPVASSAAEAAAKAPGAFGGITWDQLRELAAQGHEIANHTVTHPNLALTYDAAELERQVKECSDQIQREIGARPVSLAYPGNSRRMYTDRVVLRQVPVFRAHQYGLGKRDETPAAANAYLDKLIAEHRWDAAMIHGLEDGAYDPLRPAVLEAHLQYAQSRADELWIGTFGEVARYVQEAEATRARVLEQSADRVTFTLETALDPELFNVPLTVIVSAPNATAATATDAAGNAIPTRLVNGEVLLNAKPGTGPLTVQLTNRP
ncbi:MAG: polysaccharide deacetylase family protein [Verrucomicrobiales bacterium]|jgi:peptidoglycan/xylan/chitin deacetylase (PgdA/CDA1 family)|nr:polysaccharide deacetylase family protein [Verrucomicrobiales bacterium]